MGRVGLAFVLVAGLGFGCQFVVPGFEVPPGTSSDFAPSVYDFAAQDLASIDLAVVDLASVDLASAHEDLSSAPCGGSGQACCAKGTACNAAGNLACNKNVCTECSSSGVACCPGTGKPPFPFCVGGHFCGNGDKCN